MLPAELPHLVSIELLICLATNGTKSRLLVGEVVWGKRRGAGCVLELALSCPSHPVGGRVAEGEEWSIREEGISS